MHRDDGNLQPPTSLCTLTPPGPILLCTFHKYSLGFSLSEFLKREATHSFHYTRGALLKIECTQITILDNV